MYPVNPTATHIASVPSFASIKDIPGEVDLAVVAVPAKAVPEVVEACGRKGVGGLVIVSSHFAEDGAAGAALEREAVRLAHSYGMRIVGPNCFGVLNTGPAVSTAALASSDEAVAALFQRTGVIRVDTIEELFDVAQVVGSQPLGNGLRVAVLSNAGGLAVLAVDACESNGLQVPEFSAELKCRIEDSCPRNGGASNPVDLGAEASTPMYEQVLDLLLAAPAHGAGRRCGDNHWCRAGPGVRPAHRFRTRWCERRSPGRPCEPTCPPY